MYSIILGVRHQSFDLRKPKFERVVPVP